MAGGSFLIALLREVEDDVGSLRGIHSLLDAEELLELLGEGGGCSRGADEEDLGGIWRRAAEGARDVRGEVIRGTVRGTAHGLHGERVKLMRAFLIGRYAHLVVDSS